MNNCVDDFCSRTVVLVLVRQVETKRVHATIASVHKENQTAGHTNGRSLEVGICARSGPFVHCPSGTSTGYTPNIYVLFSPIQFRRMSSEELQFQHSKVKSQEFGCLLSQPRMQGFKEPKSPETRTVFFCCSKLVTQQQNFRQFGTNILANNFSSFSN